MLYFFTHRDGVWGSGLRDRAGAFPEPGRIKGESHWRTQRFEFAVSGQMTAGIVFADGVFHNREYRPDCNGVIRRHLGEQG